MKKLETDIYTSRRSYENGKTMAAETYQIIWSFEALHNLNNIINYLSGNWNEKVVNEFLNKINNKLSVLEKQPFIGSVSTKKYVYKKHIAFKTKSSLLFCL